MPPSSDFWGQSLCDRIRPVIFGRGYCYNCAPHECAAPCLSCVCVCERNLVRPERLKIYIIWTNCADCLQKPHCCAIDIICIENGLGFFNGDVSTGCFVKRLKRVNYSFFLFNK